MIDQCAAVRLLFTYPRHHSAVSSIAYNPSRKEFVSVDKTELHSWNQQQQQLSKLVLPSVDYLLHLIFIPEKDIYLSCCVDGSFRLYDSKVRFIRNFITKQVGVVSFLLYVSKNRKLLTAGADGVHCWTIQGSASEYYEREWVSTTNFDIRRDHTFHYDRTEWVRKIVVDEASNRFFAIWDANIDVCDLITGKRIFLVKKMFQEHVLDLLLHPITRTFIVACRAGAIHVLNDDMTYIVTSLRGHTDDTTDIHVHGPSGLLLSSSRDKTIRMWDIDRGQEVFRHALPRKCHRFVALSKARPLKFLCLLQDGKIQHFELTYAFRYYTSIESEAVMSMERGLIICQDKKVQIHSPEFDLPPKEFQSEDRIEGFSHDQDLIVLLHPENRLSFYSSTSKLMQRIQIINDSFDITCISILFSFVRSETSSVDPETTFKQEALEELNELWIGCGTSQGQLVIFTPSDLFCVVQDVSLGFSIDYVVQNRSNQRIVTVGTDNCLRLWSSDLKILDQINDFHPAAVDPSCIKMSDPYHLLICGFDDGQLVMIDIRYSKLKLYRPELNHQSSVVAADFLESKPACLTSSVDMTIKLWDHHLMLLRNFQMSTPVYHLSFKNPVGDVLIACDQTLYLISSLDVMPTRLPPDIRPFTENDEVIFQQDTVASPPDDIKTPSDEDRSIVEIKQQQLSTNPSAGETQTITRDTSFHQTWDFLPLPVLRSSKLPTKQREQSKSNQSLPLEDRTVDPRFQEPVQEESKGRKRSSIKPKHPIVKPPPAGPKKKEDQLTMNPRRPVRPTARPLWGAVGAAERRQLILHKKA